MSGIKTARKTNYNEVHPDCINMLIMHNFTYIFSHNLFSNLTSFENSVTVTDQTYLNT